MYLLAKAAVHLHGATKNFSSLDRVYDTVSVSLIKAPGRVYKHPYHREREPVGLGKS